MNKQDKKNSQGLEEAFEILAKIGFPNIVFSFFIIFIVLSGFDKRTEANKPAEGRNFILKKIKKNVYYIGTSSSYQWHWANFCLEGANDGFVFTHRSSHDCACSGLAWPDGRGVGIKNRE